jgi:membrane protein required for colicin V production
MNWLDIVLAVILLISTLSAAAKGFSREIIGLAAAVLGLLLASQSYRVAGQWLRPYVSQEILASAAGFLLVFFGVIILGAILSSIVRKLLKAVGLSAIDRLLGALYGMGRGVLIGTGIVLALIAFTSAEAVVQSRMAPYLIEVSHVVLRVAPQDLQERFRQQYDQVKSSWSVATQKN